MILSANMVRLYDNFGHKGMFDVAYKAGFRGMEFNLDREEHRIGKYDEDFYRELGAYARERGIIIGQAHAPFASSYAEKERTDKRFDEIVRAIKYAACLGATAIVVHPGRVIPEVDEPDATSERVYEYNLDFYRRLAPYAREAGIRIAIENLVWSVTSTAQRLNRLYDELNDPVFTVCLDIGHCLLEGVDPAETVREVGHRLVDGYTHIHDNNGDADTHTLPYYGKIDWESVMKALADIGYEGNLNYEASSFMKDLPVELYPSALSFMASVADHLRSRFEYHKSNC